MLVVSDFIDENLEILQSKGANIESTPKELFVYLQGCYKVIQKDAPQFIKEYSFKTTTDTKEYHIPHEVIDGISLKIDGIAIQKTSIDKLYTLIDQYNTYYAANHNTVYLNQAIKKDSEVEFVFYSMKYLKSKDSDIALPSVLDESLRLLFLSRVLEKIPSRNDRKLSIHYYKMYRAELLSTLKNSRQKYSNLTSNYQKI